MAVHKIKLDSLEDKVRVQELNNEINDIVIQKRLDKQGLQVNLKEMYKPLLESQEKQSKDVKSDIISKLNRMSSIDNTRFLEFKKSISDLPQLVESIENIKDSLTNETNELINKLSLETGTDLQNIEGQLENLYLSNKELEKIMDKIVDEPEIGEIITLVNDYPNVKDVLNGDKNESDLDENESEVLSLVNKLPTDKLKILKNYYKLSAIAHAPSFSDSTIEYFDPSEQAPIAEAEESYEEESEKLDEDLLNKIKEKGTEMYKYLKDSDSYKTDESQYRDSVLGLFTDEQSDKQNIKLYNLTAKDIFKIYVIDNNIPFNMKPITTIHTLLPTYYKEIKDEKDSMTKPIKTGKSIQYLPSTKEELFSELKRLTGAYKAGNKNTFNEINSIVDTMRRNKYLTIKESRMLYKSLKH
jgi:hypothetical protein